MDSSLSSTHESSLIAAEEARIIDSAFVIKAELEHVMSSPEKKEIELLQFS